MDPISAMRMTAAGRITPFNPPVLGQAPNLLWPAAAAVCLAAGAAALALERSIPAGARTTPKRAQPALAES